MDARVDARAVNRTKRDGGELTPAQIEGFLAGYVAGEIPDYQASALLMAIFVHGMSDAELTVWTRAMLHSGRVMDFSHLDRPRADKHSTGGVGDKVSIPLAPAVAACGAAVPMISGRGLGHTGGTLDKLEAIPGFRTDLSAERFGEVLERCGLALGGQTEDLAPADRKLYALRDVTGLIESVPLIASSILSKKLAEGIDALVLDVKFGSGAFLPEPERGAELASVMLRIAGEMGVRASALRTNMARPLGKSAGHTLEILESLDCLEGRGPADLRELVCREGGQMLALCGLAEDEAAGRERIAGALDDGRARETFARVVEAQGGDPGALEDRSRLAHAPDVTEWRAERAGHLRYVDVRELGYAVCALGGGRVQLGDEIDPAVGLIFPVPEAAAVSSGEVLIEVHHRAGRGLERALEHLSQAARVGEPFQPAPLVLE